MRSSIRLCCGPSTWPLPPLCTPRRMARPLGKGAAYSTAPPSHPPPSEGAAEVPRPMDEHGYQHTIVRGVVQPPFLTESVVRRCQQDFALRGSDIVIATFPKCGTTWMQQILLTLLHGGDKAKVPHPMAQVRTTTLGRDALEGGEVAPPGRPAYARVLSR